MQVAWPHTQTVFPNLKGRLGLAFCFPRNCHLVVSPQPTAALTTAARAPDAASANAAGAAVAAGMGAGAGDSGAAETQGPDKGRTSAIAPNEGVSDVPGGPLVRLELASARGGEGGVLSAMEPRVSPNGEWLVYISHDRVRADVLLLFVSYDVIPSFCAFEPPLLSPGMSSSWSAAWQTSAAPWHGTNASWQDTSSGVCL